MTTEHHIRQTIRSFILQSVHLSDLKDDDNLFESGLVNSLFAVQLMTFLEKTFSVEVTADDLEIDNFKSVQAATGFILRKRASVSA